MKYGIYGNLVQRLATKPSTSGEGYWIRENEDLLFDTMSEASSYAVRAPINSLGNCQIVGVKGTPSTTRREIVELKGTVDLDSLDGFGVYYLDMDTYLGTYVKNESLKFNRASQGPKDSMFPMVVCTTQGELIDTLSEIRARWSPNLSSSRIVGVRTSDTPGKQEIVFF